VLEKELAEVEAEAKELEARDLPAVNEALKRAGAEPIASTEALRVGTELAALAGFAAAHERVEAAATARRAERD
jgi:hypothetical protein